jgi:hypothetical protein
VELAHSQLSEMALAHSSSVLQKIPSHKAPHSRDPSSRVAQRPVGHAAQSAVTAHSEPQTPFWPAAPTS